MGSVHVLFLPHCKVRLVDYHPPKGDSPFLDRSFACRKASSCMELVAVHGVEYRQRMGPEVEV